MVLMSMALKEQVEAHFIQPLHFSVSIFIWKILKRSVREAKAPKGQRLLHWVLFFVRIGRTITRPIKSPTNIIVAIRLGIESTGLNSVTSLKGQNHSQ